jgi:O-glycosyl hydrolase
MAVFSDTKEEMFKENLTMENKAPERKVRLREEDVFYVYDKRINKCVKDGCDGTVKYGLNLKVNMPNGDTLNTYECNKCHMKYTAYPNYVRLAKTNDMVIHNQDEVAARDKKRRIDAAKQAKKEKQKDEKRFKDSEGKSYGRTYDKPHRKVSGERTYDKADEGRHGKPYKKQNGIKHDNKRYGNVTCDGGYRKSYSANA